MSTGIYEMTDTWTDGGVTYTAVKMDVTDSASAAASLLMDLQVGAASALRVDKRGCVTFPNSATTTPSGPGVGPWATTLGLFGTSGALAMTISGTIINVSSTHHLTWNSDAGISRVSAGQLRFGGGSAVTTTSRSEINKAVASIADNTATATFTVTVPNAAHSAMLKVTLVGSLGAGGAVGANEATGTISYDFAIARTAGVATVVTPSTAYGSATSAVAGAATITVTAAASAISGANSATQTFTVNVTIARGSGSSTNHTCLCYGRLLNANASGITIA